MGGDPEWTVGQVIVRLPEDRLWFWLTVWLAALLVMVFIGAVRHIRAVHRAYLTGTLAKSAERLWTFSVRVGNADYSAAEFLTEIVFDRFPRGASGPNLCDQLRFVAKQDLEFIDLDKVGVPLLNALAREGAVEEFETDDYDDEAEEWFRREHTRPSSRGREIALWIKAHARGPAK